jgi:UDP-N-acetylmuramyl pentapeptide phosphotransferase/UDP-N-acetylglucosamine-1-phosphate transferase
MKIIDKLISKFVFKFVIKQFNKMNKSWKTTVGAIAIAIGAIGAVLTGDQSVADAWPLILSALGAVGIGWFARDNKVSSEEAGAKK